VDQKARLDRKNNFFLGLFLSLHPVLLLKDLQIRLWVHFLCHRYFESSWLLSLVILWRHLVKVLWLLLSVWFKFALLGCLSWNRKAQHAKSAFNILLSGSLESFQQGSFIKYFRFGKLNFKGNSRRKFTFIIFYRLGLLGLELERGLGLGNKLCLCHKILKIRANGGLLKFWACVSSGWGVNIHGRCSQMLGKRRHLALFLAGSQGPSVLLLLENHAAGSDVLGSSQGHNLSGSYSVASIWIRIVAWSKIVCACLSGREIRCVVCNWLSNLASSFIKV